MSTVWIKSNKDRKKLKKDVALLLEKAAVWDWLGEKQSPVLLKPNLVVSSPASGGATTTPAITEAIIAWLADYGFSNMIIAEGSWVGGSTAKAFKVCGYVDLARKYDIPLIDLQKDSSVKRSTPIGKFKICKTIADLEEKGGSLINLPLVKGHGQTRITCALKNLKGCIPNSEKRRYHSLGVHQPVAYLNTIIKQSFALVDGLNPDPYWEEGGSPQKRDLLLLGKDPVAIDSYACRLLGFSDEDVEYLTTSDKLGIGEGHTSDEEIINLDGTVIENISPNQNRSEIKKWIDSIVDQKSACSSCFGNLASALRYMREENPEITKRTLPSLCIGQEFKGKSLSSNSRGIGICTVLTGNKALRGCPPSRQNICAFLKKELSNE
ncbi:MAG: DUF362 domain-containing protein [Desulfofustis sp.]|jgi:uncharacterized protein (DUF362 family)